MFRLAEEERRELERKIETIKKGYRVRPPYAWFYVMKEIVKETYPSIEYIPPHYRGKDYETSINRIVAGIWYKRYTPEQQIGIIERLLETGAMNGVPSFPEKLTREELDEILSKILIKRR